MPSLRQLSVRSRFHVVMALVSGSLVVLALWGLLATRSDIATLTQLFDQADRGAQQVGSVEGVWKVLRARA